MYLKTIIILNVFIVLFVVTGNRGGCKPVNDSKVDTIMQSNENISSKIEKLKTLSQSGNAHATFTIGLVYQLGIDGASKNEKESVKWYKAAAIKGSPEAQYMIGTYYQGGIGVEQNFAMAKTWFKKAVENGMEEARNELVEIEDYLWMDKTGWVLYEDSCKIGPFDCSTPLVVTQDSFITHWAGVVTESYYIKESQTYSRIRIKITWTSNESPYYCGQTIEKNANEIKDFKTRSFAMKPCL